MFAHIIFVFMILFISLAAYLKKSLSGTGAIAAFILGIVLYISGGVTFLAPLFAFFVSSSLLTKFKEKEKKKIEEVLYDKTGTRDHVQVFANGGAAFIMAVIHSAFPGEAAVVAFFTAFAACNADTWASEIGVLSKKAPLSILNFKPMENGISGGVTLMGTIGALGGSLLIAVFYSGVRLGHISIGNLIINFLLITLLGFLGSLLDSVLGASLQPLYKNPVTGGLTERKREGAVTNIKEKGFELFSNDMVNFFSSSIAAFLVFLIQR